MLQILATHIQNDLEWKKPGMYIITESFGTSQQRPYAVSQFRKDFIGQAVKYQLGSQAAILKLPLQSISISLKTKSPCFQQIT